MAAAATAGMKRSLGLDHARMPQRKGKVIQLDLSLDSHQGLLWKWLDSPGLVTVWIAPPLGEANSQSRHHDYEQTSNLASHSLEYPKGGPVPVQRELVCTLSAQIFKACQARDIPAVIENPTTVRCGTPPRLQVCWNRETHSLCEAIYVCSGDTDFRVVHYSATVR